MTKCTASWESSDVSFQSNKDLKIGGDQTRVKSLCEYIKETKTLALQAIFQLLKFL